jgi:hypothetical protein
MATMYYRIVAPVRIRRISFLVLLSVALACIAMPSPAASAEISGTVKVPQTTLSINSVPPGAAVFIDSASAGTTPMTMTTLIPGTHTILLKKAGYTDYSDTVTTSARAPVTKTYTLIPLTTTTISPGPIVLIPPGSRLLTLSTTPVPVISPRLVPLVTKTTPATVQTRVSLPVAVTTATAAAGHPVPVVSGPARNLTIPSLQTYIGTNRQTVGQLSRNVYHTSMNPGYLNFLLASRTLIQVSKEYKEMVNPCNALPAHPSTTSGNAGVTPTIDIGGATSCELVPRDIWGERADPYNISADLKNYRFRWATDAANVSQGRWQVANYPFPDRLTNWDNPPGLVAYGTVQGKPAPNGTVFTIPFASFSNLSYGAAPVNVDLMTQHPHYSLAPPGSIAGITSYQLAPDKAITGVQLGNNAGVGIITSSIPIGGISLSIPSGISAMPSPDTVRYVSGGMFGDAIARMKFAPQALSTTMASRERIYYVRMVAQKPDGQPADMPSPDVEVHIRGTPLYMLPQDVKTTLAVSQNIECCNEGGEFYVSCTATGIHSLNTGMSESPNLAGSWSIDVIQPNDSLNQLLFNWTSAEPGVHTGKWQLLATDYTRDAYDWDHPGGFIAEGNVGNNRYFQIDLKKYNLPGSEAAAYDNRLGTYYVRMLPLDENNRVTGPPSRPVIIHISTKTTEVPIIQCDPTQYIRDRHPPSLTLVKYEPVQSATPDAGLHVIITKECTAQEFSSMSGWVGNPACWYGGVHGPNYPLTLSPPEHSWWDDFVDFIGDLVSFIADVVNWVADAWNTIKDTAVSVAAGAFCGGDSTCRDVIADSLDTGLVAMGIPPTLPSFSELENMGTNYLIQVGIDEIGAGTALSPEDVRGAADTLVRAHESTVQSGSPDNVLAPDPAYQHKPAYVLVLVSNPNSEPTDRQILLYRDHLLNNTYYDPDFGNVDYNYAASHGMIPQDHDNDRLFEPREMPVPSLQKGDSYTIPILLKEDFGYWANNTGYGGTGTLHPAQAFTENYEVSSFTISVSVSDVRDTPLSSAGSASSMCPTPYTHTTPDGWIHETITPFTVTPPKQCFSGTETCTQPYQQILPLGGYA